MHVIVHVDIYFFLCSVSYNYITIILIITIILCIIFVPLHKNIYIALLF